MVTTADAVAGEVTPVQITSYMELIGGQWATWPGDHPATPPTEKELADFTKTVSSPIYEKQVEIGGVKLFAFRTSTGKEWDALVGWNRQ